MIYEYYKVIELKCDTPSCSVCHHYDSRSDRYITFEEHMKKQGWDLFVQDGSVWFSCPKHNIERKNRNV